MVCAPVRSIIPSLKLGIISPYRRTNHALSLTCCEQCQLDSLKSDNLCRIDFAVYTNSVSLASCTNNLPTVSCTIVHEPDPDF